MDRRETLIKLTQTYAGNMKDAVAATAPDKRTWSPGGGARSALAQMRECAQACDIFAGVLETQAAGYAFDPVARQGRMDAQRAATDFDAVSQELDSAVARFVAAVRGLPADAEGIEYEHAPGFRVSLRRAMMFPLRNLIYHEGQVNYIQTLYGDREMHGGASNEIPFPDRDTVAELVEDGVNAMVRTARATPEDKMTWSPEGQGRTILDMMEECRQSAGWGIGSLAAKDKFSFEGMDMEGVMAERAQTPDLDKWETELRQGHEAFIAAVRAFPAEDENLRATPMPGWSLSMGDLAFYPGWNLYYHLGQINYVQCLYGDHEMH
jgi:hypothetical protein